MTHIIETVQFVSWMLGQAVYGFFANMAGFAETFIGLASNM